MSDPGSTNHPRRSSSDRADPGEQTAAELARALVLRQLTAGPRTRRQLADALARRGVDEAIVERTLDRFEELQLVDDEAFAEAWVDSRHRGRGLARRALAHELRHRGVADGTVREALGQISPEDEFEAARRLVRSRLAATRSDEPARRLRRLAGLLARKGYDAGTAMRAVREELRVEGVDLNEEGEDLT